MNSLAEKLERELEDAFEVKNKESLHRYVVFLADNVVRKSTYDQNITEFRSDIKVLAETMKLGFESVEKRFEAVDKRFEDMYRYMDKRFEDMNRRFTMMFTFMNVGFSILIIITILFKFIH